MTVHHFPRCTRCRDELVVLGPRMSILKVFGNVVVRLPEIETFVDCPVCVRGCSPNGGSGEKVNHHVGGGATGSVLERSVSLRNATVWPIVTSPGGGAP